MILLLITGGFAALALLSWILDWQAATGIFIGCTLVAMVHTLLFYRDKRRNHG